MCWSKFRFSSIEIPRNFVNSTCLSSVPFMFKSSFIPLLFGVFRLWGLLMIIAWVFEMFIVSFLATVYLSKISRWLFRTSKYLKWWTVFSNEITLSYRWKKKIITVCHIDYKCKIQGSVKQTYIYFGKLVLNIFESVAVGLYSHHGFQLTMVGRQWVSAKNVRFGLRKGKNKSICTRVGFDTDIRYPQSWY